MGKVSWPLWYFIEEINNSKIDGRGDSQAN